MAVSRSDRIRTWLLSGHDISSGGLVTPLFEMVLSSTQIGLEMSNWVDWKSRFGQSNFSAEKPRNPDSGE